jgi:hypothetical protein
LGGLEISLNCIKMGSLIEEVTDVMTVELARLGVYKSKKAGHVYTCDLGPDFSGWIGLGIATRRGDKRIGISPTVGVRSEKVEALVEKYWGRPAPTISISLGYVMPQLRYLEWLLEPLPFDFLSEARKVTEAIGAYGDTVHEGELRA